MVSVGVDDWKIHRVYPSLPVTLHINTDVGENTLRKISTCNGINLSVDRTSFFNPKLEKSLPVLLEYPSKWRSLELHTSNEELVPFLVRCSPAVPYLTYLSIYMSGGLYDKQIDLTPISQSIRRDSIKLKEACLCWSLLDPFNQLGLLVSLTSLTISFDHIGPEHEMVDSIQLISNLPNLEELEFDTDEVTSNLSPGACSFRFPSLRSVCINDAHPAFVYYCLPLFKETKVVKLNIGSSLLALNGDAARVIHESIPGLVELSLSCVSLLKIIIVLHPSNSNAD